MVPPWGALARTPLSERTRAASLMSPKERSRKVPVVALPLGVGLAVRRRRLQLVELEVGAHAVEPASRMSRNSFVS